MLLFSDLFPGSMFSAKGGAKNSVNEWWED